MITSAPASATFKTMDGNEAVASVAYRLSELAVIYPITPSSPMGEWADEWAARGRVNLWGQPLSVSEMQSEGGAAGAVHGALLAGALATTFTASQGLLLMVPNMFKIAGELLPFVMHVAARSVATHALSIFGDHSDVMAARMTGFAMLSSASVQEAHDLAAIAHAATLETRLPFAHFMDGFRTSHEVAKIRVLDDEALRGLLDAEALATVRGRALSPDDPVIRGTAQNPDVFFQAREAANPYYLAAPSIVQGVMDRFARLTGRSYRLFDYEGHPEAERVIVIMGSGGETACDTAEHLARSGERVGVVKVRLYRPFDAERFVASLPANTRSIAVLDRTKEPGAVGEPLMQDVLASLYAEGGARFDRPPSVVGGRYGLSSKEFTPAMVRSVYENLAAEAPRRSFTVGILDDVTRTSLAWDPGFTIESGDVLKAVFYGLGSDGTVGANKNTIKIIGEQTEHHAQGYFVYDSKKSGAMTVSHLRFGPRPLRTPYLIPPDAADFVGCHQFVFTDRFDVLELAKPGATLLLNAPYSPDAVWDHLPVEMQEQVLAKGVKLYVIDALKVAREAGMGSRINTIMQVCFFAISGVLPRDEAIRQIKSAIEKTYGVKGPKVVAMNFAAVDAALDHLHAVALPAEVSAERRRPAIVPAEAPDFVQRITAEILAGRGDLLPVSAVPVDGAWPTGTAKWEKRGIAAEVPIWAPDLCIQCNKCAIVCPHAAIRAKAYEPGDAPDGLPAVDYKAKDLRGLRYTIQVAPDDCTGCNLCVMACPAKSKAEPRRKAINMEPRLEHLAVERQRFDAFLGVKPAPRERIVRIDAKGSQFFEPLMEFSGACAGCGETPYLKLLTQLFGDRLMIANATGCSSIYGGNLPTTPYTTDAAGRGPAWANSLFEDNAEFGYGMRLAVDAEAAEARRLVGELGLWDADPRLAVLRDAGPGEPETKRAAVGVLRPLLDDRNEPAARRLLAVCGALVPRSVWLVGGDGWAYDIGFGGLDHVLAQGRNVNVLVLDTEVYSNTGGQASKATPLGAAAKFAASGKAIHKKDLGLEALSYGHVYVASVAMGASDNQTVKALLEAESYDGPSLVIAYSHCIAHGYDLKHGLTQQQLAVDSGVWPLYRFDPRRAEAGEAPLRLDARPGKTAAHQYMANETRFRMVEKQDPARFRALADQADREARARIAVYQQLAQLRTRAAEPADGPGGAGQPAAGAAKGGA